MQRTETPSCLCGEPLEDRYNPQRAALGKRDVDSIRRPAATVACFAEELWPHRANDDSGSAHETFLGSSGLFHDDPKGKRIPSYLAQLAENVLAERERNLKELDSLRDNIEHIKRIVSMQQGYSKVSTLRERANLVELMEDALQMNDGSFNRHEIEIVRDYADVPVVETDKHKILQILVNLIRNAKDSCKAARGDAMRITLRLAQAGGKLSVSVMDNGIGIAPENMARIFRHGFTTKKDGHGFGLHSSAIAARELGGSLTASSDGAHRGATFTLELPLGGWHRRQRRRRTRPSCGPSERPR